MRMRKKKNGTARLLACDDIIMKSPAEPLSDPASVFGREGAPVFLEIGAGKGGFACKMAQRNPDACYIAMERVSDCVVLAAEKAKEMGAPVCDNLRFIVESADNLSFIFENGTVDRLFLNFSDPWSKKGYAKRRLTHRRYLALYFNLLKDGGSLTFKTDNVGLFDFSLEEIESLGLRCEIVTRDLHASEYDSDNIRTEYEEAFSSQGIKINMLRVVKPEGFSPQIPTELSRSRLVYKKETVESGV